MTLKSITDGERTCLLKTVPQLAELPEITRAELNQMCQIRKLPAGHVVADVGDEASAIGFVSDGILRMQKTLPDGRQHLVGLLVSGDMFGRVFDGRMQFAIEAATDATLLTLRRAPFEALLARSPELDRLVLSQFLTEIDCSRDWMIILSTPRVRGRLAGFLLILCTRFRGAGNLLGSMNGDLTIQIPISRADLANFLGARPESVSRAFHALADDGILSILRPDLVAVASIEALAEEAGDPYLGDRLMDEIQMNGSAHKVL
jgi:CRP/FNR family transcriptional regulator